MPGGLLSILSYGSTDLFLTGAPQISFFKIVYRRHTNFSVESIEIGLNTNVNFGDEYDIIVISRTDLLSFNRNTTFYNEIENLKRLAQLLEKVRTLFNLPIHVNSAYRSVIVNKLVGSQPTSQHCIGCAADIKIPGMTPDAVCRAIIASDLQYDQLIREFDSWTHISIPNEEGSTPRGQTLIIDRAGTRPFV